jgi:hypothetical protein
MPSPASNGSTASARALGWPIRSPTASSTAQTVSTAPASRGVVTGCGPAGPAPSRSTSRLLDDWPATRATMKTATPSVGTVRPWVATRKPPQIPPTHCHGRIRRSRRAARR